MNEVVGHPAVRVALRRQTDRRSLRASHIQAWYDLKAQWRYGLLWALFSSIFVGYGLGLWASVRGSRGFAAASQSACLPDGRFSTDPSTYDPWSRPGFFEITLGHGELSYTQAKVIDIAWDVIVGRGGQALVAYISWAVFARYVTSSMHAGPVTFNTFRTFFLQRDISTALGTTHLTYDFFFRQSLQSRAAMVFMVTTMAFTIAFPTFAGAMTGYSANVQAYIEDRSGNYVPFSNFRILYYTIHDGDRISRTKDFQLTSLSVEGNALPQINSLCGQSTDPKIQENCDLLETVTNYVRRYGTNAARKNVTHFRQREVSKLDPPSLNISVHYLPKSYLDYYMHHNNFQPPGEEIPIYGSLPKITLQDQSRMAWSDVDNFTYSQSDVNEGGKCQPTKTYKWGFSFIQLFIMICMLVCWSIGLASLYAHSYFEMIRRRYKDPIVGNHRAVFQLADAMGSQLSQDRDDKGQESDVKLLSEAQLNERIEKDLKGGSISYEHALRDAGRMESEASTWEQFLETEIWWIILLAIAVTGCFLTVNYAPYLIVSYLAPTQIVFARYVGRSTRTRIVLLFWQLLVLGGIPTIALILHTIGQVRRNPRYVIDHGSR